MTFPFESYSPFLGSGDFSEIYLEDSSTLSIRWEDDKIDTVTSAEQSGAGIRIINGLETRFGHLDITNPLAGLTRSADSEKMAQIQRELSAGLPKLSPEAFQKPIRGHHSIAVVPNSVSLPVKIGLIKKAYNAARLGPEIRQININYGEKIKKVGYLNSKGETFIEDRTYVVFSITVTAERDRDRQKAYESRGGLAGLEILDGAVLEGIAREVAQRAIKKLSAPSAPVGEMPVVITSSAGGTLIHEAIGHSLEADAVLEGTSPAYLGKIGKVVANERLTVFDDPTLSGQRGSFVMDDEGTPAEATKLIENGVLKAYLFDRLSAKRANRISNGHGRRESYMHRPIPRMSNTFVAPGSDAPDEIIHSLKNGFLVTKMGGGQVNTATGDFVFEVEEGFQIKNGSKTLVRGATLLGNGPDVLMKIDRIGSDFGTAIGTCGKEGQGVPVSDGLPTISIKKLVIGGTQ